MTNEKTQPKCILWNEKTCFCRNNFGGIVRMKHVNAGEILKVKTGKYDANHAKPDGAFKFFTCAIEPLKTDTFAFDDEVLILPGNGVNVGEVLHYKGKLEAYQRTYVLHEISEHPKYLYYYFKKFWVRQILKRQVGSATNYIKLDDILSFQIPLPPLPVQRKIAAILDEADKLRQLNRQLIQKYEQLTQSLFLEMFGDTWINPRKYKESTLSEIVKSDKIITYGIVQAGPHIDGGIPYIRTGDLKDGKILLDGLLRTSEEIALSYERSKCNTGDIIMSIRATVGTCAILPKELDGANLTQGTARISVDVNIANTIFVYYAIKSKGVQLKIDRETKGATFREITLSRLRKISIPVPPIHLQNQFAERIQTIEAQKAQAQQSLEKSEELFQSLLQRAFKGELVKE